MRSRQRSRSTNKSLGVSRQRRIARVATIVVVTVVAIMGVWELGRYYHKWGAPNEPRAIKAEKITKMHDALNADNDIIVTFENLKLTAYAMITSEGKLISGISGKAENFSYQIVSNIVEL